MKVTLKLCISKELNCAESHERDLGKCGQCSMYTIASLNNLTF